MITPKQNQHIPNHRDWCYIGEAVTKLRWCACGGGATAHPNHHDTQLALHSGYFGLVFNAARAFRDRKSRDKLGRGSPEKRRHIDELLYRAGLKDVP